MSANPTESPIAFVPPPARPQKITESVVIGKDVLELITGAMYVDPLTIYREYIQNAADSIDEAKVQGLYDGSASPRIEIHLDQAERSIRVRDNGAGVPGNEFVSRLSAIGGSQKRGRRQRGFRGVGRLSGLGYAQDVIFRSRAPGDAKVLEIHWSGRRLREVLRDPKFAGNLEMTIKEVAEVLIQPGVGWPQHFFEVELRRVTRVRNDLLLNPDEIRSYLSQVAPVPFAPYFRLGNEIAEHLKAHGIDPGLHIQVSGDDTPIYRPFRDNFKVTESVEDGFASVEFLQIPGNEGEVDAIGWVLHHSYFGALPRALGVSGLRARSGNIQVGNANVFEALFTEPRFNSWCVGEIHVLTNRVVPNGRRDDFEMNAHHQHLISHASALAGRISKECRDRSILRNRLRQAREIFEDGLARLAIVNEKTVTQPVRLHYKETVAASIEKLERLAKFEGKFTDEERALIAKKAEDLRLRLSEARPASGRSTLSFLPDRKRKLFLEMLSMVLEACDSPEQGATIAKRIIDQAKRLK